MKAKELLKKSEKDLQTLLQEQRQKLRDERFKVSARQLKNVRDIRATKKTIATILTVLRQKKNTNNNTN